jgi:hypothetical protein
MGFVRVRPAEHGGPCAVRHPEHGEYVVPNPAQPYPDDDPLVRAYPWLFVTDAELAEQTAAPIEQATRGPGERRTIRRPR